MNTKHKNILYLIVTIGVGIIFWCALNTLPAGDLGAAGIFLVSG